MAAWDDLRGSILLSGVDPSDQETYANICMRLISSSGLVFVFSMEIFVIAMQSLRLASGTYLHGKTGIEVCL